MGVPGQEKLWDKEEKEHRKYEDIWSLHSVHFGETSENSYEGENSMARLFRQVLTIFAAIIILPISFAGAKGRGWMSDPGAPGPYAVGHVNYMLTDSAVYDRAVAVSVWYPADAETITSATPPAEYPLDPWSDYLPVSTSEDWEALGYDSAYEGPAASDDGPFPLVIVSPGAGCDNWFYNFVGTRLASHGFVVAATDHYGDGQWPWLPWDGIAVIMLNRARDVSFVITELLQKSRAPGELLHGTIDPSRIAMSGHSIGGYAAYALAGGDDKICDALWVENYGGRTSA